MMAAEEATEKLGEVEPIETDNTLIFDTPHTEQEQGAPIVGAPVLLPRSKLVPFPNHPFKLYTGTKLDNLVDSIKANGILEPLIVRPVEDTYQILAGHNRDNGAGLAGLDEVPCIIRNVDDDEAAIIVVETNYLQRGMAEMLPSEIAKSLKMELDALKHQGKKTDEINYAFFERKAHSGAENETCVQFEHKLKSRGKIAEKSNSSISEIQRYLRLNYLTEELLQMVDEEKIPVYIGAVVSHLTDGEQELLATYLNSNFKLDVNKAKELKELSAAHKLNENKMREVLTATKKVAVSSRPPRITKPSKRIKDLFPDSMKPKEVEDVIAVAVEEYLKTHDLQAEALADDMEL